MRRMAVSHATWLRSCALTILVAASAASWLACGGGGSDLAAPELGTLEITTITTGPEQDADGYAVKIDDDPPAALAINGTLRQAGLPAGSHVAELSGLAPNCTASPSPRQTVSVAANAVTTATFTIACVPTTGSIQVTTSTGELSDPDGYQLILDGTANQPIGVSATLTLESVSPGTHTVGIEGVDAGCGVVGSNPITVGVVAGATTQVPIAVTCTPSPESGAVSITTQTTGPEPDADGYAVSMDGGAAQAIGVNATVTVANLIPGSHSLALTGISTNCTLAGANPRVVNVPSGGQAEVMYRVTCSSTTGALAVSIAGLPGGVDAVVNITGPNGYGHALPKSETLSELVPGSYAVTAEEVTSGGTKYTPSPATRTVTITAGGTGNVSITYNPATGGSLNLRIDGWHLTQSVQSDAGDVPLVNDRDGFLRVFVVANQANSAAPSVRVRLYRRGDLTSTLTIPAPSASTPMQRNEANLASSWNVKIPRALIAPGLAVLVDVDPANAIVETNEGDNSYPLDGAPGAQQVVTTPVLSIRFVPVRQSANGLQGNVSSANKSTFLQMARQMFPLPGADGDAHAVYTTTTSGALQSDDGNGAWGTILSEIDALRLTEGTARTYYGVVRIGYQSGIAGLGYIGRATAMGYDEESDKGRVATHELGHTFNRNHAPCGNPGNPDRSYPYPGGEIGVFGFELQTQSLKAPSLPDIMGYCANAWISDYTYRGILTFRGASGSVAESNAATQRCLLVWGRIVDGRPILEPAFEVVTRPSLPKSDGRYTIEGVASDGTRLLSVSFDPTEVEDGGRSAQHFAFTVPMGGVATARLQSIRLVGPAGAVTTARSTPLAGAAVQNTVRTQRSAGRVKLRWDSRSHPMILVRDRATGEVLSFARGGDVEFSSDKRELDLTISDGVSSQEMRMVVP